MAMTKSRRLKTKAPVLSPATNRAGKSRAESVADHAIEPVLTKTADNKGRIALGSRFANRAVIIETLSDTEVVVKLARVIPESEAWLYENAEALSAVRTGLAQARAGRVVPGPALGRDAKLVSEMED